MPEPVTNCESCKGLGWLVASVASDNHTDRLEIQRCDACGKFESDFEAEQKALNFLFTKMVDRLEGEIEDI